MKRFKRILAMLMAVMMMMGMSLTSFAAESLDIPVTGADGAIFKHAQLIGVDTTTPTGWKFSSDAIATAYKKALEASDDQTAIWMLIKKENSETVVPAGVTAATDSQIAAALREIAASSLTLKDGKTVTEPGVYYIQAVDSKEVAEVVYNPMAAYVSFEVYDENGVPSGLVSDGVTAKKEDIKIQKDNDNNDDVTEIGRTVIYTIRTFVPYIAYDNKNPYVITDTIIGAEYQNTANEKITVNVKVGDADPVSREATLISENSFTLDLTDYAKAEGRVYAGQPLVITYSAKVTDMMVHNNVVASSGDHTTSANDFLFTGTATLTKVNEENEPLADAKFVLKKGDQYATFTELKEDASNPDTVTGYKLSGWVASKDDATVITTGSEGTVTVKGLDNFDDNAAVLYQFEEVEAPSGYSVNETPANVAWGKVTTTEKTIDVGNVPVTYTESSVEGTASMTDTKLASLPATGGIGTYIFTIAGILIMAAAAGFFFVSRRKADC